MGTKTRSGGGSIIASLIAVVANLFHQQSINQQVSFYHLRIDGDWIVSGAKKEGSVEFIEFLGGGSNSNSVLFVVDNDDETKNLWNDLRNIPVVEGGEISISNESNEDGNVVWKLTLGDGEASAVVKVDADVDCVVEAIDGDEEYFNWFGGRFEQVLLH